MVRRANIFQKADGIGRRSIRKSWPRSRDVVCIIQEAVRMFLVHRVYVCTTYGVRVRVTSLRSPRRAGRYGARVPTRALRTDTRHRAAATCKHTRYTPACSHTLCRCTGPADATDSITPTGYWRRRFFKLLFLTSNLTSVETLPCIGYSVEKVDRKFKNDSKNCNE